MNVTNVHPIFVHFPIGLLTVYSILEIARIKKLTQKPYWFYIKAPMAIAGAFLAHLTILTGLLAEEALKGHPALEIHEKFAFTAAMVFDLLALAYAILWAGELWPSLKDRQRWNRLSGFAERFLSSRFSVFLAFAGLVLITITGALGAAMVYGPNIDPAVKFIYSLLVG